MKNTRSLLAALILLGSIATSAKAFAADGVIAKDEFAAGSYCHQKFQTARNRSRRSKFETKLLLSRSKSCNRSRSC